MEPKRRCGAAILAVAALALPVVLAAARPLGAPFPLGPDGRPTEPAFFPIGVWLQDPVNAAAYRELGINLFIGLWEGPTAAQLDGLRAAGMPVIADQNALALARADDPTLAGWLQQDEPDNAQPDGSGGYGPCIAPEAVVARYQRMRTEDPRRPVLLNLGQGVAWDLDRPYIGRGSACAAHWEQYPAYVAGADIVSFDIYPVTSPYEHLQGQLWRVALGIDRLREWTKGAKPVWAVVETTHIDSDSMPTADQVRTEVWMALVHGASGLFYFAHEWQPTFREAGLLHYPEMRAAVSRLNRELTDLAPVLNSPSIPDAVGVTVSDSAAPVDILVKQHDGWTFVAAVAMRERGTDATFTLPRSWAGGRAEVLGEGRTMELGGAAFSDHFDGYAVHLYRVPLRQRLFLPRLVRGAL